MTLKKKADQRVEISPECHEESRESRLKQALEASEKGRLARIEQVKAKTGRTDLPVDQRKLTQLEAAAYCDVSPTTIARWTEAGLKTVSYGQRRRYLVEDLKEHIKKLRKLPAKKQ